MILLILLTILVIYIFTSWVHKVYDSYQTNVPGPIPWPILGNGFHFVGDSTNMLKQFQKLRDEYGDLIRIFIMGRRFVLVRDPNMVESVMSNMELITKGEVYRYIEPWLGQGLLTSTGNKWKAHRKFLTPAFHFNILQSFLPIFVKNDKILIKKLKTIADGKSVDVFPIIAMAALDNISESAMGVCVNAQSDIESEYVKNIKELSEIVSQRMFDPTMMNDTLFKLHPASRIHAKAVKYLHDYTSKVIKDRLQVLKHSNVTLANYNSQFGIKNKCPFLDLLLLSEIDGKQLDFISIREEVDTFMFEGHDTTASAISFSLYCLSHHEDVQNKILEEQKSIFGDNLERDPSYSELTQMKYLELVIKEALRLYPSVPLIARYVPKDTDIKGYKIQCGTTLTMDIYHMQRDSRFFDEPLEFRPERFEDQRSIKNYTWVPFSAGPRNCIGQRFAMMEVKTVVASVVKNFKLMPSNEELKLGADLILRSKNGIPVKFAIRH